MTDHTVLSKVEDVRALERVNQAIAALGTDARGGKDAPSCSCADCAETNAALSGVPLVAIGPPGYEHDVAGVPSLSPALDAIERAKAKPITTDDLVSKLIAEARKVCRDFAELEGRDELSNDTKWSLFDGVAGLQGAIAALDMKKG